MAAVHTRKRIVDSIDPALGATARGLLSTEALCPPNDKRGTFIISGLTKDSADFHSCCVFVLYMRK